MTMPKTQAPEWPWTSRRALLIWNAAGHPLLIAALLGGMNPWWLPVGLFLLHAPVLAGMLIPSSQLLGPVVTGFFPADREVWITIDDGPDPEDTPELVRLLRNAGAKATFFWIGEKAAAYPDLVELVRSEGHEIANHTHTHPSGSFWCAGPDRTRREIFRADQALASEGRFRAPAGLKNVWLHGILGRHRPLIGWTVRGLDGFGGLPADVVERLKPGLKPGGIVLFHEGRTDPSGNRLAPQVLSGILACCEQRNLRSVIPADSLLGRDGD